MKKTIIASAVAAAVAAPAAFADVSIGGMVNPEWVAGDSTDELRVQTDLVFSGSEDLGNGLKASFKYAVYTDTADKNVTAVYATDSTNAAPNTGISNTTAAVDGDTAASEEVADLTVTLSGDFGSLAVGRMEGFAEGKGDAFFNIDHAHELDLEPTTNSEWTRKNGSIQYTSPSFNGLKVAVNSVELDGNSDASTEYMVSYSNAGLSVFGITSDDGTSANDYQMIGASYKMGDLELRAAMREDGTADTDFFGAKYTMGNNSFAIGATSNSTSTDDATIFSAEHAMSKNVSVYVTVLDEDTDSLDKTVIGLRQKF
jgi:predicted porin